MASLGNGAWRRTKAASWLSLFTSSGTLICCALPAFLVALGAGSALSTLISFAPQLVWFSLHKGLVFGIATLLLVASGLLQWRARNLPCPIDTELAAACLRTRRFSWRIYLLSIALYAVGGYFAFVAPLLG